MRELQIPTQQIPVRVYTDYGIDFSGNMYIAAGRYETTRPEEIIRVLNDERSFLPFKADLPTPDFSVLNKSHIARVSVEWSPLAEGQPDGDPYDEPGFVGEKAHCRLMLADGTRLEGEILVDTPSSLSRLVDKLNSADEFVRLVTEDRIEFVQTRHIVQVG